MKLTYQKELNLNLYRHWSISESLHHTIYTAAKFKIWTHKGKQKLSEFLAELGLPLVQVKQTFATMDLGIRTELRSMFEEKTEKYGLEDITYNSFVASFGFRHKFCAADIVFAVLALLEQLQESVSSSHDSSSFLPIKVYSLILISPFGYGEGKGARTFFYFLSYYVVNNLIWSGLTQEVQICAWI